MNTLTKNLWHIFTLDAHDDIQLIKPKLAPSLNTHYNTYKTHYANNDKVLFETTLTAHIHNKEVDLFRLLANMNDIFRTYKTYENAIEIQTYHIQLKQKQTQHVSELLSDYNALADLYILRDYPQKAYDLLNDVTDKMKNEKIKAQHLQALIYTYKVLAQLNTGLLGFNDSTKIEQYKQRITQYLTLAQANNIDSINHDETLFSINNYLLISYMRKRKYQDAIDTGLTNLDLIENIDLNIIDNVNVLFNTYTQLANAYLQTKQHDETKQYINKAITLTKRENAKNIHMFEAYTVASFIHNALKETDKALDYANLALPLCVTDKDYIYGYESFLAIYKELGNHKKVEEYTQKILEMQNSTTNPLRKEDVSALCTLAETHYELKEYDKALDYADKALQTFPSNTELARVYRVFTDVYLDKNDEEKLITYLEKLLKMDAYSDVVEFERIIDVANDIETTVALPLAKALLKVAKGDEQMIKIYRFFIQTYVKLNDTKHLDIFTKKLIKFSQKNETYFDKIGIQEYCDAVDTYVKNNQVEDALALITLVEKLPLNDAYYMSVYKAYLAIYLHTLDERNFVLYIDKIQTSGAFETRDLIQVCQKAIILYSNLGKKAKVEYFTQMLDKVTKSQELVGITKYFTIAQAHIDEKAWDDALISAQGAIKVATSKEDTIRTYTLLTHISLQQRDLKKAETYVNTLIPFVENVNYHSYLGIDNFCELTEQFYEKGNDKKALKYASYGVKVSLNNNDLIRTYNLLKKIYFRKNDTQRVETIISKLVALRAKKENKDDNQFIQDANLEYDKVALALNSNDPDQALVCANRALNILKSVSKDRPEDYRKFYTVLASIYHAKKSYKHIIKNTKKALAYQVPDATYYNHLDFASCYNLSFIAHTKLNDLKSAEIHLNKAIELYRKNLPKAQKELKIALENKKIFNKKVMAASA